MKYVGAILLTLVIFCGCDSKRFTITEDYIYDSEGFSTGFTINALKVSKFDSTGLPKEFKDSIRVDLITTGIGGIPKKIWFNKSNEGYYWTKTLDDKYETMPLKFEKGVWYHLWSNEFKTDILKTNLHSFFLNKDEKGLQVLEQVQGLNF